jgi:hypothetical protein
VGGPFSLLAGQHALVVRDSRDVATPAQTVAIPTPILITGLRYTCGGGNYVADFTVSGGTAPYKVGGTPFGGGPFTTGAFPSGSSQTLDVVDREGCEVSVPLQRTCPPECNLPCEGIAVRHGYRFWLPEPDPMAPYKSFKVENLVVSIDAKEGEPGTDLTSKIKSILRGTAAELDAGNFPSLVAKWIGRINDLIKTTPGYSDPKGDWLTLAYDPAIGPNFRGTLWIERFECLSFSIQMRITATRTPQNSRESITETFDLIYSRDGTSVTPVLNEGAGKEVIIPLFGGTRINKCAADPQPKPFCEGVNFTLRTKHDVAGKRLFLDVFTIPLPEPVTFVWEVQDGAPAMSNKDHFETEVLTFGTKMVTVTAYTEDGCFVAAAFAVNVG